MKLFAEHRLWCEDAKTAKKNQERAERELGRRRFEAARRAIHGFEDEGAPPTRAVG